MNSGQKLQSELQPGDQIIATRDEYYDSGEFSQKVGDIIMVNNARIGCDIVSGTGLNGVAYNGRKCIGLGGSLRVGSFRRATPDDAGFMATREQWGAVMDEEISRLKAKTFAFSLIALVQLAVMIIMVVGP